MFGPCEKKLAKENKRKYSKRVQEVNSYIWVDAIIVFRFGKAVLLYMCSNKHSTLVVHRSHQTKFCGSFGHVKVKVNADEEH